MKISHFLFVVRDYLIRDHCQVGIAIVEESSLPVHQPYVLSVEQDIIRPVIKDLASSKAILW